MAVLTLPGSAGEIDAAKRRLRAAALECRQAWAPAPERERAARRACERLMAAVPLPESCAVSAFWPLGDEIDTRPLLEALHAQGHAVGLPIVVARGHPLQFRRWRPQDAMVAASFGIMVPPPEAPLVVPEIVVAPLLAFDRAGYRLGYGGGFYDRTLAGLRALRETVAVGYGFAAQEVEAVPRDAYDQRLDWIVTEEAALKLA
jgi:5-formyltetrahydrofolate cyclo-ligase